MSTPKRKCLCPECNQILTDNEPYGGGSEFYCTDCDLTVFYIYKSSTFTPKFEEE